MNGLDNHIFYWLIPHSFQPSFFSTNGRFPEFRRFSRNIRIPGKNGGGSARHIHQPQFLNKGVPGLRGESQHFWRGFIWRLSYIPLPGIGSLGRACAALARTCARTAAQKLDFVDLGLRRFRVDGAPAFRKHCVYRSHSNPHFPLRSLPAILGQQPTLDPQERTAALPRSLDTA